MITPRHGAPSSSWYEYASKKIPVTAGEELLLNVKARSSSIVQRHMKVLWLDARQRIVGVTYVNDVEEKYKSRWNTYEQVLQAPSGAVHAQFHVLTRGSKTRNGSLDLTDYSILPYASLMAVDNLMLFEGSDYNAFFGDQASSADATLARRDSMARTVQVANPTGATTLYNFRESPNPLWQLNLGTSHQRGVLTVNGVTTAFVTDQAGTGDITIILRTTYYASFVLVAAGLLLFLLLFVFFHRIDNRISARLRRRRGEEPAT